MQFLAALNIHLSGDKTISKDAMREFFHNLSMQALSKSDDLILLKFDPVNRLNKRINSLLVNKRLSMKMLRFKNYKNSLILRPLLGMS